MLMSDQIYEQLTLDLNLDIININPTDERTL